VGAVESVAAQHPSRYPTAQVARGQALARTCAELRDGAPTAELP